jgi:LysM repeat protein
MRGSDGVDYAQGNAGKGSGVVTNPSQSWTQHEVTEGESLDRIARQYGVSVADLRNWNQLSGSRIKVGQVLEIYNLPEARMSLVPTNAPKRKAAKAVPPKPLQGLVHKVKKGETVFEIARAYSVQPRVLMAYNNLRSSKLRIGQTLRIPQSTHSGNVIFHQVKKGDTLFNLAKKYGVPVEDIQGANDLAAGLKIGDQVAIPSR